MLESSLVQGDLYEFYPRKHQHLYCSTSHHTECISTFRVCQDLSKIFYYHVARRVEVLHTRLQPQGGF